MRGVLAVVVVLVAAVSAADARSLRAIDGDTFAVNEKERVRIIGIDAPEMRGRCPEEVSLARAAQAGLAQLLAGRVVISRKRTKAGAIVLDKYGRTLAAVRSGGRDVAQAMIGQGLARPYAGGQRQPWCAAAARRPADY